MPSSAADIVKAYFGTCSLMSAEKAALSPTGELLKAFAE